MTGRSRSAIERLRVESSRLKRTITENAYRSGVKAVRSRSAAEDHEGVTVATVTWNSLSYLEVLIRAVRQFSPVDTKILVIDNNSSDGTKEYLAALKDVTAVFVPFNIGHGLGCDLAVLRATTSEVVILDVDAFPTSNSWLSAVLDPLKSGAVVAGAHLHRSYVHPCFLAIRRRDFLDMKLSFERIRRAPTMAWAPNSLFMDVGEALSQAVRLRNSSEALHLVPATSHEGPGMAGMVFGNVVYHNFYSTQGKPKLREAGDRLWDRAVAKYLE